MRTLRHKNEPRISTTVMQKPAPFLLPLRYINWNYYSTYIYFYMKQELKYIL
jgi:hypothetical protein